MRNLLLSLLFGTFIFSQADAAVFVTSKVESKSNGSIYEFTCEYLSGHELRYYHPEYKNLEIWLDRIYIIVWLENKQKRGMVIETNRDIPETPGAIDIKDVLLWDKYQGTHITGPKPEEYYVIRPHVWKLDI